MHSFEYEITMHGNDTFNRLTVFCSAEGECSLEEMPVEEARMLVDVLNERGVLGWELVQILPGKDGLMAFWKRRAVSG
ncbi:MAG TPA: hypothetical protein VK463_00850 [Desulfomonilaceae bacterium]|nr:hypothetical protein [Desulfomonilaceae bacterium]